MVKNIGFKGVLWRAEDRAARYALQSVMPPDSVEPGTTDDSSQKVCRALQGVADEWHARVMELRELGWENAQDGLSFLLNCPPPSVMTKERKYTCRNYMVCPFCWCRTYPVELWRRFHRVFYPDMPEKDRDGEGIEFTAPKKALPYDLLEIRTTTKFDYKTEDLVDKLGTLLQPRQAEYLRSLNSPGASQIYTFEPPNMQQDEPHWLFNHRILALYYPMDRSPSEELTERLPWSMDRSERTIRRHCGITYDRLLGAIGRTYLYPKQMLRGPARYVMQVLKYYRRRSHRDRNRKLRLRASQMYGLLRNAKAAERKKERAEKLFGSN